MGRSYNFSINSAEKAAVNAMMSVRHKLKKKKKGDPKHLKYIINLSNIKANKYKAMYYSVHSQQIIGELNIGSHSW